MKLSRPKTMLSAFLAVIFPLTLFFAAALFLAIQTNEHNKDHQFLENKLNDILVTHSSVLALPVWNLDENRVHVIIEAISKDPDLCGIAVFDKHQSRYGAIGVFKGVNYEECVEWAGSHVGWKTGIGTVFHHFSHAVGIREYHVEYLVSRKRLLFQTDSGIVEVGDLFMAISYENLGKQFLKRAGLNASVSLFALLLVTFSILIAYRHTVGFPLARLLKVIKGAQTKVNGRDVQLNLRSVGEVDRVTDAFLTLQSMQAELETKLWKAKDSLEQQVEERTKSLMQSKIKLQESEKKYRELFENILDVSYQTDEEGNFVLISPSVKNLFGYHPEELMGKQIRNFYHNQNKREEFLHQLNVTGLVENFEAEIIKKDGTYAWVSTNARLLLDKDNNFCGVEGVTRDITQLKKAEKEKERLETRLQQAQKMEAIGTLAGGIAHDFNNILSAIIGFTELVLDEVKKGTNIENNLKQVYTAGIRARDLVKRILTFSRHSEMEFKPVKVTPLVKEALKLLRSTIPASIEFEETFFSGSLIVYADSTQLHQVIVNLATNAKQAMFDGTGVIEVVVDTVAFDSDIENKYPGIQRGNYARITVSDTGRGIPEKDIEKIFDPYFTTKEKGEGTGLGLAMVHGIVKSHKGYITVYSKPGKGTSFHVYLPLIKKDLATLPGRTIKPLPTGTEWILVVDDEQPLVEMHQQSLKRLGYTVTSRTSSTEAVEVFRESPDKFDLVITDMSMPKMTGDKLAQEIKAIRSDMPVILCTGFSEKINGHGESLDIDEFLMKPVDNAKMANTVRKVLDEAKCRTQQ